MSNISDRGYAGPHYTVALLSPLLRDAATNSHATLITLFMNVVDEQRTPQDEMNDMAGSSQTTKNLFKYLRPLSAGMLPPTGNNDPSIIKFNYARDFVARHDRYFDR